MSYIIGYVLGIFLIAFVIVHFFLKKKYFEKNNKQMSTLGVIGRSVGIGAILLLISMLGQIAN